MSTVAISPPSVPRQRWFHILLPIMTLCIVSYVDRTNISFAIPGGMSQDLAMTASFAGFAAGIFFIGYLFLQVPGGQIASRGAAKKFLTWSMVAWGIISIATAFITSQTQLLILRFILGVAEGGMLPVALTMISKWFPDEERGRATATMIMFVPIASMISAPLAGFVIQAFGWRQLFFFEGVLTFFLIIPWVMMVEEDPQKAKWISPEERDYIVSRLEAEQQELAKSHGVRKATFGEVMRIGVMWKLIMLNFFYQTAISSFVTWLPTLIKGLLNTNMTNVGLFSLLPYIGTMVGMLTIGTMSDRTGKRKQFVILPLCGLAASILGYVLLKDQIWVSYACLVAGGFFLQAAAAPFWTIPPLLFPANVAGGARGALNALGNLGGFCGPFLVGWCITQFGSTDYGMLAMVVALGLAVVIALTLPNVVAKQRSQGKEVGGDHKVAA
jgi:sugar phosphate permease